jgi:hypothetical protein
MENGETTRSRCGHLVARNSRGMLAVSDYLQGGRRRCARSYQPMLSARFPSCYDRVHQWLGSRPFVAFPAALKFRRAAASATAAEPLSTGIRWLPLLPLRRRSHRAQPDHRPEAHRDRTLPVVRWRSHDFCQERCSQIATELWPCSAAAAWERSIAPTT